MNSKKSFSVSQGSTMFLFMVQSYRKLLFQPRSVGYVRKISTSEWFPSCPILWWMMMMMIFIQTNCGMFLLLFLFLLATTKTIFQNIQWFGWTTILELTLRTNRLIEADPIYPNSVVTFCSVLEARSHSNVCICLHVGCHPGIPFRHEATCRVARTFDSNPLERD